MTPGPWEFVTTDRTNGAHWFEIVAESCGGDGDSYIVVAEVYTSPEDARRIVAAVNATAGISTDALEAGAVRELVEANNRIADLSLYGDGPDDLSPDDIQDAVHTLNGLIRMARERRAKVQQP